MGGTVVGTVNGVAITIGGLLKTVSTVVAGLNVVLTGLTKAVAAVSVQLSGVLIASVNVSVNISTSAIGPIVNLLNTAVIGGAAQLVLQVSNELSNVFTSINGALPKIVDALDDTQKTLMTAVSKNLLSVELSLKLMIAGDSQSAKVDASIVVQAVAKVVVTSQDLVKSVQAVAADVVENIETAAKAVEAVPALVVVLSAALNVVLQVVAKSAEFFNSLPTEVQTVLKKAIYTLNKAVKGVTKIVATFTTAIESESGATVGLKLNLTIVLQKLDKVVSSFISNALAINKILAKEVPAPVEN